MKLIFAITLASFVSVWLWPSGFFDIPFSQMTFKILFQFAGSIAMALWGVANLYNRLGPYIAKKIIEKSIAKSKVD